jgi:hypothetical protein
MKPRTIVLALALGAVAACSLGGKVVDLGGAKANQAAAGAAGSADNALGGGDAMAASGAAAGTLNVGDADTGPVTCPAGTKTTVSGTVYDPSGHTPLYNAVVYIPIGGPPTFDDKVACEKCTAPVKAVTVTLSGSDGSFVLDQDVPNTDHIELAVQLGKWFRQMTVPIKTCSSNLLTDKDYTRLPKSKNDGEYSHIPKIALSTGHSDALECLLRKIGIDDSEFTTDAKDGRVNMFVGCVDDNGDAFGANQFVDGTPFPSTNELFDSGNLSRYDVVIFSCEGHKCDSIQTLTPNGGNVQKLVDFANKGGRVYLDHDHYNWLNHAGDFAGDKIETAVEFSSSPNDVQSPLNAKINNDPSFPKGEAFAQWLVAVGASQTEGTLQIYDAKTSVESMDPNRAQPWIYGSPQLPDQSCAPMCPGPDFYLTIGTPVFTTDGEPPPASYEPCGRVVFTDLHVSKADGGQTADVSEQDKPFPTGCVDPPPPMTAQEKALEFMIFDLTSCVQKETDPPTPPIVVK